jgi:RNA polymerase sigma factor (sigma-70 family)
VRAAADGSEAAWNRLVDGFLPMLWSAVKQYRLSPSDAADVIQTTWLRLVQNLHRLENPAGVGGYLVVTVRREALRVSGQGKQTYATDNLHVLDRIDLDAPPCDASLLSSERDAVVRELFLELPERCREFLSVVLSDPVPTYREISERLGIPVGSIGPTRARYLNKLSALAAQRGVDLRGLATRD